jgi:Nif-specific regulatory protein
MSKLVVIEGPDRGKEFALEEISDGAFIAGRDPRHAIALADTTVSREHFRIEKLSRGFRVVDLGSRNRTFVNGEPVVESYLRNGDVIALGDSELRFEDDSEGVAVAELSSTILKEVPTDDDGGSIARIIDSLRSDPALLKKRLERAVEHLRRLFELGREMLRSGSVEDVYQRLLEILVPALEADHGVVLAPEVEGWTPIASLTREEAGGSGESTRGASRRSPRSTSTASAHSAAARASASEDATEVEAARDGDDILVSRTVIDRVAREKKAVLSSNASQDRRFRGGESIIEAEIRTVIAAPIAGGLESARVGKGRSVTGILYADRRGSKAAFTEDELDLLCAAAEQAGNILVHIQSSSDLRHENRNLLRSLSESRPIIGDAPAIAELHSFIRKAAPTAMTVLIRGETGTGKDLVASAIHYQSPRQGKPFIAINCAALPENLLESELFGYEKGAFTGAMSRKKGRFELAHTGTIFLDEVAELSPGCQAKLLRLLEEQRFERVGGTQPIEVDVRIIAASNKDLAKAIEAGEFREDLFYRLNVLAVQLPPLRERREDILLLARYFLKQMGVADERTALTPAAEEKLRSYAWPGNVRQLRNVIESAVVLKEGPAIDVGDLVLPEPQGARAAGAEAWSPRTLEDVQREHIVKVLEHTDGNKKRAAEVLGIERCTLYAKLKGYGLGSPGSQDPS